MSADYPEDCPQVAANQAAAIAGSGDCINPYAYRLGALELLAMRLERENAALRARLVLRARDAEAALGRLNEIERGAI